MKNFVKVLITILVMSLIMAAGIGIYKLVLFEKDKAFETQRTVRVEELTPVTQEIEEKIAEVSQLGHDEIQAFIDDNAVVDEDAERTFNDEEMKAVDPWADTDSSLPDEEVSSEPIFEDSESGNPIEGESVSDNSIEGESVSDNSLEGESVSDNSLEGESVSDNSIEGESVSDNSIEGESVSDNSLEGESVSDNSIEGESVSGNSVSGNSVSGNSVSGNSVSGNSVSGNSVSENSLSDSSNTEPEEKKITLKDRQSLRTSYEETYLWMESDSAVLENTDISFEGKKIACIGDSITEAANLLDEPNYAEYPYPKRMSELLGAEVQNLGIGGSSYGRYWYEPFCERYLEIDEDTDYIIVMGGTNDGFCLEENLIGSPEECEPRTLYGDIDELFAGLKENYPDAEIFVATPMPNLLHDVLRKERPELLPETVVVNAILEEAAKHDLKVIDLYNSNFFDSHDADVVSEFIPDSVHPNPDGYEVLARHLAAEMIRNMDSEEESADSEESAGPEVSASPEETASPEESATPEESADPEESASPEESATPEKDATPKGMEASEETEMPEETEAPEKTAMPEESGKPSSTPKNIVISRDS